jgi:hypothetical protein
MNNLKKGQTIYLLKDNNVYRCKFLRKEQGKIEAIPKDNLNTHSLSKLNSFQKLHLTVNENKCIELGKNSTIICIK